jgi:hypothetical protein
LHPNEEIDMIIEPGKTLVLAEADGTRGSAPAAHRLHIHYTVRAVRHYPIDFAELEPVGGGKIRTATISMLERLASDAESFSQGSPRG